MDSVNSRFLGKQLQTSLHSWDRACNRQTFSQKKNTVQSGNIKRVQLGQTNMYSNHRDRHTDRKLLQYPWQIPFVQQASTSLRVPTQGGCEATHETIEIFYLGSLP